MSKKVLFCLLFVFLVINVPAGLTFVPDGGQLACSFSFSSTSPSSASPVPPQLPFDGHKLLLSKGHGEGDTPGREDKYIVNITDWFESLGGTVIIDNDTLTAADFSGVTAALIGSIYQPPDNFSIAEANVIRNWFLGAPNRFLWVGGSSDYLSGWVPLNASMILETVGSHLRMEPAEVLDPVSNCGAQYRVTCNWTNTADPVVAPIISDVDRVLFFTPTLLYGVDATGSPVAIDTTTGSPSIIPNVHVIMQTSASGVIVDRTPLTFPMYAHTNGATGHFAMMAAELNVGGIDNKLIASGAPPYGDYEPLWSDSYKGYNLNGSTLVKNAITWGLVGGPSAPVLTDPGSLDNDGIVNVTWSESMDANGYITHYQLQMSNLSTFSTLIASWNTSNLYQVVSGLSNGTYYFRVRAFDDDGNPSAWSNIEDITVGLVEGPSAPVLTDPGSLDNDGIVNVTWSESMDANGYITHYQLQMSNLNNFSTVIVSWNTSNLHQVVSGLSNGTYYFRVRAFDNHGNPSTWSNIEDITVQIETLTPPIPGFPVVAITLGVALAMGLSMLRRRRKH